MKKEEDVKKRMITGQGGGEGYGLPIYPLTPFPSSGVFFVPPHLIENCHFLKFSCGERRRVKRKERRRLSLTLLLF